MNCRNCKILSGVFCGRLHQCSTYETNWVTRWSGTSYCNRRKWYSNQPGDVILIFNWFFWKGGSSNALQKCGQWRSHSVTDYHVLQRKGRRTVSHSKLTDAGMQKTKMNRSQTREWNTGQMYGRLRNFTPLSGKRQTKGLRHWKLEWRWDAA